MEYFWDVWGQRLLMTFLFLTSPSIKNYETILKFVDFWGRLKVIVAVNGGHFEDTPDDPVDPADPDETGTPPAGRSQGNTGTLSG